MKLPEEIVTERLILRKSNLSDLKFYFDCGTNPKINKYMSWLAPQNEQEIKKMLENMNDNWEKETAFNYTIYRKYDNERIGTIEPIPVEFKASIGYVITPENWGKGYAAEAVKCMMENIFKNKSIKRFWAVCDTENSASAKVMQKCGMQFEGILRKWRPSPNISSEPRDVFCYSLVR